jgi:hypothetical protein
LLQSKSEEIEQISFGQQPCSKRAQTLPLKNSATYWDFFRKSRQEASVTCSLLGSHLDPMLPLSCLYLLMFVIALLLPTNIMLYTTTRALNFPALYEILTRPTLAFVTFLMLEGHRHCDVRIPRVSLQNFTDLAFKCLLDSGNDQSLLNACGHDHASFH